MSREQIKQVIQEKCIKAFGKDAKIPWELDEIVDALVKYSALYKVDVELALAQGILECHFGCNPQAVRSRKTRNIFNVGNVDNGGNRFFKTWDAGIERYFRLMAREYCWRAEGNTVTVEMMLKHDFRRPKGGRYATSPSYTVNIGKIAESIAKLLSPVKKENTEDPEPKQSKSGETKAKGKKA